MESKLHRILVKFASGRQATYTTAILYEPLGGLMADSFVVEIIDLETGEILKG